MPRIKVDYVEVLDLFLWGLDKLMRPTLGNMLAGFEEFQHRPENRELLRRMERRKLIQRHGDGPRATFSITEQGRRWASLPSPQAEWDRPWDGRWRAITFDVPESRRRDREALWRSFRAHKLGLLQRSVWVWPHELEPLLREIIQAEGIPECFCGLEVSRLFLCTDLELVESAWDWGQITRQHQAYLRHPQTTVAALKHARDLAGLARIARVEGNAYREAFVFDPLLPRRLWLDHYAGMAVVERHKEFRRALANRMKALSRI